MDLRRTGEAGFLRALFRRHRAVMPPPPAGPGDDAALASGYLLTADALLEGEHFLATEPAFLIGRKSVAVGLSDIAAMGGAPRAFLLCLGLPAATPGAFTSALLAGIASAAAEHGVAWAGGDTVRSPLGVVITVTVLGARGRRVLTRSGARPGDGIYVTGPLGASAAGRALISAGWKIRPDVPGRGRWRSLGAAEAGRRLARFILPPRRGGAAGAPPRAGGLLQYAELLATHLDPAPRLTAARFLSSRRIATAAIDVSDGLSLDLHRLCLASGVGALVHRDAIPISHATRFWADRSRKDPLEAALQGGEDYEILFTAPRRAGRALASWPERAGPGPILIGRIRPHREGVRLADARGRAVRLRPRGYDAFRELR